MQPGTVSAASADKPPAAVPANIVGYPKPPECNWSLMSYPYPDPALTTTTEEAEPQPQPQLQRRTRHRRR